MPAWGKTHDVVVAEAIGKERRASPIHQTSLGSAYCGDAFEVLDSRPFWAHRGKVQLVFTSPPFPLNTQKSYGNLRGEDYVRWLARFAPLMRDMVTEDGSIEIGNTWMPGQPTMSTHALEAFLRFLRKGDLHLCQEFIWYNPARLPSPIEWVSKERSRVKDAFTRLWWISPTPRPKADNRKVLREYSSRMKRLIEIGKYNARPRPSGHHIGVEKFRRSDTAEGLEVLPCGWVVERPFAWLGRCRRLARDWERFIESSTAWQHAGTPSRRQCRSRHSVSIQTTGTRRIPRGLG